MNNCSECTRKGSTWCFVDCNGEYSKESGHWMWVPYYDDWEEGILVRVNSHG